MTEIKSAIENLKEMYPKKCQMVDGRYTGGFDDYESEKGKSITLAIRSLSAWEGVLQELEHDKEICFAHDSDEGFVYARAIDIINQKLAEIEE